MIILPINYGYYYQLPINKSLYQIHITGDWTNSFGRQVPVKAKARAAKRKAGASVGMAGFFSDFLWTYGYINGEFTDLYMDFCMVFLWTHGFPNQKDNITIYPLVN